MVSVHGCPMVTPGMHSAGGMNVYLRRIAPLLAEQGVCVDVFTRNHNEQGPSTVDLGPRARVIHLPAGSPDLTRTDIVPYLPEYRDRLLDFAAKEGIGYDLVHSHYWLSRDVGAAAAKAWGVPHVFSFHSVAAVKERASGQPEPLVRKDVEDRAAEQSDLVFVFTPEEAADLSGLLGIARERIHVVPAGVDAELFAPRDRSEARRRLGLPEHGHIVLFVGRPEPFKGPDLLVRALAHLGVDDPPQLLIVGGSEDEHSVDWLKEIAAEAGVASLIQWRSAVPQASLPDFYAAADVCAVPSFHETFGLAALEAMACGRPVAAAAVGALQSLVSDGETGMLVPSHDPAAFADRIRELLADPQLRERMGRRARERAVQFTWDRAASLALDGYARATSGWPGPQVVPCLA